MCLVCYFQVHSRYMLPDAFIYDWESLFCMHELLFFRWWMWIEIDTAASEKGRK